MELFILSQREWAQTFATSWTLTMHICGPNVSCLEAWTLWNLSLSVYFEHSKFVIILSAQDLIWILFLGTETMIRNPYSTSDSLSSVSLCRKAEENLEEERESKLELRDLCKEYKKGILQLHYPGLDGRWVMHPCELPWTWQTVHSFPFLVRLMDADSYCLLLSWIVGKGATNFEDTCHTDCSPCEEKGRTHARTHVSTSVSSINLDRGIFSVGVARWQVPAKRADKSSNLAIPLLFLRITSAHIIDESPGYQFRE